MAVVAALMMVGLGQVPASAAGGFATFNVHVKGVRISGEVGDLPGAKATLYNLDTHQALVLDPYGTAFHASTQVPYGRYRLDVTRPGFISQSWPRAFSSESAAPIWFGDSPDCEPTSPALCASHRLEIQLSEAIPVSGRVRLRDGRAVGNSMVTATRLDEPAYRPSTLAAADGSYSLPLPPGTYALSVSGRTVQAQDPLSLTAATNRDVIVLTPPGPVPAVTAAPSDSRLAVSWQPPSDDGGSPVTRYRAVANPGGAQCITTATGCTLEGLQNGQAYRISVTAENAIGIGEPSLSSTPVAPTVGIPGPVRNVRVSSGTRSLSVTWSAPVRGQANEYTARAWPGGRSCSTTDLECTITGLKNGTLYRVEVTARSDAGRADAVQAPRRVRPAGPPSAPRDVKAKPVSLGLRVGWTKPLDDGGHGITRYVATVWPGGRTCTSRTHRCTVRGLDPRTHYSVTVRARSSAGEGAISPGSVPVRPGR